MIGFAAPAVLFGLLALPLIWWLLRLTPPKPQSEIFPPLRLLARVIKPEETPARSPWWLTLLRLVMAALIIIALAKPLLNPRVDATLGDGPLLVMIDNGWAKPAQWQKRTDQARALIDLAARSGQAVALMPTVFPGQAQAELNDAQSVLAQLDALEPQAAIARRDLALDALLNARSDAPNATLALLSDGLAAPDDQAMIERLSQTDGIAEVLLYGNSVDQPVTAINGVNNGAQSTDVTLTSTGSSGQTGELALSAYDSRARLLANAVARQNPETGELVASFDQPFELRNDFAVIRLDTARHSAAAYLLDDSNRRRRVALVTGLAGDQAQPLLSPLFYIRRAIAPFTDLIEARTGDLTIDIPEIIAQAPAMIVLADVGVLPQNATDALEEWISGGGTLVRFAGPRLAAQNGEDELLPVDLRQGERALGGSLSWVEPQAVAPFPSSGPFSDLDPPREVTVTRQVLAEPNIDLGDKTWAILADGTPLVTGEERGRGAVVLFHVTAEATWSNLPISGTFVEMLQRITTTSSNTGGINSATNTNVSGSVLAPLRILRADGEFAEPGVQVKPFDTAVQDTRRPNGENPAGLYGTSDAFTAINILQSGEQLTPININAEGLSVTTASYPEDSQSDLSVWLFAAALILLALDTLAVLWINGQLRRFVPATAHTALVLIAVGAMQIATTNPLAAQETPVEPVTPLIDDATAIDLIERTRMAYVETGIAETDDMTLAGLSGLTRFIALRTALEPAPPVGIDLETDELAFFPLIYFAIDASADLPSARAISRLDAYMQNGGTVLFDTRDQLTGTLSSGNTPENNYLRSLLQDLNIPALEPVPSDHVLTKAFYILDQFPGRYAGSPLWVEALRDDDLATDRPVRSGDGVSPIMITGNDMAAAWALDEAGRPLAAINSSDPLQRIYAFRSGVNIMMYMLTGNYKADQVHIPALLERLGQ